MTHSSVQLGRLSAAVITELPEFIAGHRRLLARQHSDCLRKIISLKKGIFLFQILTNRLETF